MPNFKDELIIKNLIESKEKNKDIIFLQQETNIYEGFETLEQYPIQKLLTLYYYLTDLSIDFPFRENEDKLFADKNENTINGRIHTQIKVLERILNLPDEIPKDIIGDELVIINEYGYKTQHCKGRLYGYRNTMTLVSRQCRYYLFHDKYFDLDLKNAHPTILLSYARNHDITTETLESYCSDRESFLQNVMSKDKITRSEAKTAVLRCLNLVSDKSLPNSLKPLHKDILPIRNHLYVNNIEKTRTILGEYTQSREGYFDKSLEKRKISLQAQYCASEESASLKILYEVCIRKGLLDRKVSLNGKRCLSFIPFFDGAYIKFNELESEDEVNQILTDVNDIIFPYSFELKKISPEWVYIEEEDLEHYETIIDFLGELSEQQYFKLLSVLNVDPVILEKNKLNEIKSYIESYRIPRNKATEEHIKLYYNWDNGGNHYLQEYIKELTKQHLYSLRRALLKRIKEKRLNDLRKELKLDEI